MNGLQLFGKEVQQIIKNKKLLISMIAVLIIPLIYGGMFLWTFKDPYANMSELPVAVVNLDEGASMEGKEFQIGDELVKNLKENGSFHFEVVSEKTAMDGLDNLDYYMAIVIPENFSKNATTLLNDHPEKLELTFYTNDSYNFLASQIGETAIEKIKTSVSKEVSKTYAEVMFDTAMQLADGFKQASDGTEQLNDGATQLLEGATEIKNNLELLASKSVEFTNGIGELKNGSQKLADSTNQLSDGLNQLSDASNQLLAASQQIGTGADSVNGGIAQVNGAITEINKNMPKLESGTEQLISGFGQIENMMPRLIAEKLSSTMGTKLNLGIGQLKEGIITGLKEDFAKQLTDNLTTQITEMAGAMTEAQSQQLVALLKEAGVEPEQMQFILNGLASGQEESNKQLAQKLSDLTVGINAGISQTVQGIEKGFDEFQGSVEEGLKVSSLEDDLKKSLSPKLAEFSIGLDEFKSKQMGLINGIAKLQNGTSTLAEGANQLASGQKEYVSNFQLFNEKLREAASGSEQLANGTDQLNDGMSQLLDGTAQLVNGTGKLADGSGQLADGMDELQSGTSELHEKLSEAADKASAVKATDETYDMMADPVSLDTTHVSPVPNYGTGFAPYFISLGLFVGALIVTILFPMVETVGTPKNGFSWFGSKFAVLSVIGITQALLIATFVLFVLKIEVQSVPLFYLFTILTSLTFVTLIQFLTTVAGDVGRFVAILILILQLTSSAGTFPLEVIPKAIQFFNPLLPMTYTVRGYKAVISSGNFGFMWENVGFLFVFISISILLTLGYFLLKFKKESFGQEVVENQA